MIATSSPQSTRPEFTAELDRSLVNVEGRSVRHLVLTFRAPEQPPTDRPRDPLNLGLVIDASGSMAGPPLDAAKEATLSLIERLADDNHLSLVSFAGASARRSGSLSARRRPGAGAHDTAGCMGR